MSSQEVIELCIVRGFYGFGAGAMMTAIVRFQLWIPSRVNVKQFRQPFHRSTNAFDRVLVTASYLTFSILCLIFLKEIVDYFFLGLEHQLQKDQQQLELHPYQEEPYLLLLAHHVTSVFLIWYCSIHGATLLPVFASVGAHCFKHSVIMRFLSCIYGIITPTEVWLGYELLNMTCYFVTVWSVLAYPQNYVEVGLTASKRAALMWMYTIHVLNLFCNTDYLLVSQMWVLVPMSVQTIKAIVFIFLVAFTFLYSYIHFSDNPLNQKHKCS